MHLLNKYIDLTVLLKKKKKKKKKKQKKKIYIYIKQNKNKNITTPLLNIFIFTNYHFLYTNIQHLTY